VSFCGIGGAAVVLVVLLGSGGRTGEGAHERGAVATGTRKDIIRG